MRGPQPTAFTVTVEWAYETKLSQRRLNSIFQFRIYDDVATSSNYKQFSILLGYWMDSYEFLKHFNEFPERRGGSVVSRKT